MTTQSNVLVVVDMQNGFVREQSQHVVPVIADIVSRWQSAGGDVVFTRYLNYPGSPFQRIIGWSGLMSSPATDIVPELSEYADKATAIVSKTIYSAFNEEGLALFRSRGWTDVYVCGIATESCVLKTAVDAFELGFTPWVIEDASASHAGQTAHDAGLLVTRRFIGKNQIIDGSRLPIPVVQPR